MDGYLDLKSLFFTGFLRIYYMFKGFKGAKTKALCVFIYVCLVFKFHKEKYQPSHTNTITNLII